MIQVKHMFQAWHVAWMLLAFVAIAYGIQGLHGGDDSATDATLRTIGPWATVLVGLSAFRTAIRRRGGEGIGRIQALLERRDDEAPRREEIQHG